MSGARLDPIELVKQGANVFFANVAPLLGGVIIIGLVVIVLNSFTVILGTLLLGPLTLGYFKAAQNAIQGRGTMEDLAEGFRSGNAFLHSLLVNIVVTIFCFIGFLLLIIPGILIGTLYLPVYLFLLNEKKDFWSSMERSRQVVSNNYMQWLILGVVLFVINLIGAIPLGLGLLITAPISAVAITLAYQQEMGGPVEQVIDVVAGEEPDTF